MPEVGFFVATDALGRVQDPHAARLTALERVVTTAPYHLSSLVRVPMASAEGGGPHVGGALFSGPEDPAAQALRRWIDAEVDGAGGEDVALTELEEAFGERVLPVLVRRCGFAGCHGPAEVANTAIPAVRDPSTGTFAPLEVRDARRSMRKFLDLWGSDVGRSRLVRKALGRLHGLPHRGGPGTFFPEAPDSDPLDTPELEAILSWGRAERAALGVEEGRMPRGLVYVRQPIGRRAPYRIEREATGSDLFFLGWPLGESSPENLTATLHPEGPVEIREPTVAHDGRTVAFAMRRAAEERFSIWELDLETRVARQVSPIDAPGSFVSPVYGPDARLVAAWDGHGEPSNDGPGISPELVALESDGTMERLTFTRSPEVRPRVLASGKTRGMLVFGTRRYGSVAGVAEGVLFRFPPCHDPALHGEPEYHVQFGASIAPLAPLVAADLPDGRQIMIVLSSTAVDDDRGLLAVLDRALGPRLLDGAAPSVGGLIDPLTILDVAPDWRDPAPLPDGRVLIASDRGRPEGSDALIVVELDRMAADAADVDTLLAEDGFALRSPAVVLAHPVEDDDHSPITHPASSVARIALRDVAVLEAIYGRSSPTGVRPLRTDLRAVRVLTPVTTEGAFGTVGARILGEVELAADRSVELLVPARTPVRLQFLDAAGMETGRSLDRWFYGEGDELLPAGTNPETYRHDCASCHGSFSGIPEDAIAPAPDVLSSASVTLSTHALRDRRRPLPPTDLSGPSRPTTFEALIAPLLAERCVRCHGGDTPAGALSLELEAGSRSVYDRFVSPDIVDGAHRANRSPLLERLLGVELSAPGSPTGRCPPEGLEDVEVRDVCRWIESGATYREVP